VMFGRRLRQEAGHATDDDVISANVLRRFKHLSLAGVPNIVAAVKPGAPLE